LVLDGCVIIDVLCVDSFDFEFLIKSFTFVVTAVASLISVKVAHSADSKCYTAIAFAPGERK